MALAFWLLDWVHGIQLSLLTIFSLYIFLPVYFINFVLAASLFYSNTRKFVY